MAGAVRKPSALVVAALSCLALAGLSLLLPSGPSYDPYQWLIWGRELAHLRLDTTGSGTSWKPLPALVAALLSPLGRAQVGAWLVVARAGALFAAFMTFRLAVRLVGPRWAVPAGLAAAASFVLTPLLARQAAVGNAEGLATACALLAFDRHWDGRRGQAFACGVGTALIRPESWPFLLVYGAWLWLARERPPRWALALGGALVPLLWFGGDWVGSGRLTTASDTALHRLKGTAGAGPHPAATVLHEAWTNLPLPGRVLVPLALAFLAYDLARGRRPLRPLALAAAALAWTAIVAAMAAHGYVGVPRFLFVSDGLWEVLAGSAVARIAELVPATLPRPLTAATAATALVLLALMIVPDVAQLRGQAAGAEWIADEDAQLTALVREFGGTRSVFACGHPYTGWFSVTALAYDLGVEPDRIHDAPHGRRPVVFMFRRGTSGLRAPLPRRHLRVAARAGVWKVVDRCGARSATQRAPRDRARVGSRTRARRAART